MRILFASDGPPNPDSGAAGTVYQLAAALRRAGHEVDAVWASDLRHRIRHGNLHYLLELPGEYRRVLRERAAGRGYDVYQVSQPHGFLAATDHRRSGRRGIFVHLSHGLEGRVDEARDRWRRNWNVPERPLPQRAASRVLRRLLDRHSRLAARFSHGTLVGNSLCRDFLLVRERVAPETVEIIAHPAPASYLTALPPAADAARSRRVLYVGQHIFVKGPRIVAEAMRALAERFPDATFTWVCGARHHAQVGSALGAARHRVELLPWQPQEVLREIYDRHGIFLFPSLFEGFGKAFLEAMARGLCVVGSDEGGMHDLLRPGENGFRVPVGDASAVVEAAARAMTDPDLFGRISATARVEALRHTWDGVAAQCTDFYARLLDRKARRHAS